MAGIRNRRRVLFAIDGAAQDIQCTVRVLLDTILRLIFIQESLGTHTHTHTALIGAKLDNLLYHSQKMIIYS